VGGSKAGKPLTLKSGGRLKPSSLIEVYAQEYASNKNASALMYNISKQNRFTYSHTK